MVRLVWICAAGLAAAGWLCAVPVDLRCDYLVNPIGIDSAAPHLSWRNESKERNWRQAAYQIFVASRPERLAAGKADVWDSGKVASGESVGIVYGGPPLESGRRYYWTVRVWDHAGRMSEAAPAWWEMGLLQPQDWKASWIARRDTEEEADRSGIEWVWLAGQDPFAPPPQLTTEFQLSFALERRPRNGALYLLARGPMKAWVNGQPAGAKDGRFLAFDRQDVTELVRVGTNTVRVTVSVPQRRGGGPQGAARAIGFAGLLKLVGEDGTVTRFPTGPSWQARAGDGEWRPAQVIARLGDPRMGPDSGPLPAAASLFRREFAISKPVRSARLYITALGSYRAFLNGSRVGEDVLTPEYTEYRKRVTAQTYDVTGLLAPGQNAVGVILGDGWFGSALSWTGVRFSFLPPPARLLAQLRIEFADGSEQLVVTDETWKTAPAPILHSEIYAGEVYDARLEQPGWNRAGFDHSKWAAAVRAEAPPSQVSGAVAIPPRIVETLRPREIRRLPGGGYIVDMGQNMVGWLRVRVSGAAGPRSGCGLGKS